MEPLATPNPLHEGVGQIGAMVFANVPILTYPYEAASVKGRESYHLFYIHNVYNRLYYYATTQEGLTGYIKAMEWKMGQVMNTLRLFFTGNTRGLGISDIIYFIGKEETLRRIRKGLSEEATAQTA